MSGANPAAAHPPAWSAGDPDPPTAADQPPGSKEYPVHTSPVHKAPTVCLDLGPRRGRARAGRRGVGPAQSGWGGAAVMGSIDQTGAPPPLPSTPLLGPRPGGRSCRRLGLGLAGPGWPGGRGVREPESRGAGGGAEPTGARSCRTCFGRPSWRHGNFPATALGPRDPACQ